MNQIKDLLGYTGETKTVEKKCPKHGSYTATLSKWGEKWRGGECEQCIELDRASRKMPEVKTKLTIPKRFTHCSFDNYQVGEQRQQQLSYATAKKYAENFKERLEQGGGLVLHGTCGTGKTHLVTAIARHVQENKLGSVLMCKVYEMTGEVKSTWGDSGIKESDVLKRYMSPDLLIIDEIGVQFDTEAEKQILFRIINRRYEDMKPTIIVSNLLEDELKSCLGERVIDRMNEGGGSRLVFDWPSYRK